MTWPAPAKLNLFLHITGKRPDGYHLLQTAFQFLDYSDLLDFELRDDEVVHLTSPLDGVSNDDNLIVRAAKSLQPFANRPAGVNITLDKRLPMGGGLGGGSSDAATTLLALNQLWQCELSTDTLASIGLSLGADVPIFIHGHAAWAEGVGEKLTPISPDEPWYVIISPDCHVSTEQIFLSEELTRDCEPITISRFLSGEGRNICEDVVTQYYPPVSDALHWLAQFGNARMTGTGACVFASVDNKTSAQQVLDSMPSHWTGFIAKGCNQSPLITSMTLQN